MQPDNISILQWFLTLLHKPIVIPLLLLIILIKFNLTEIVQGRCLLLSFPLVQLKKVPF